MRCTVCEAEECRPFLTIQERDYWRCAICEATFLAPAQHPSRGDEFAEYGLHRNDIGDPDYRSFLSRLAAPLLERIGQARQGLDFGCGPGPALAAMLREAGHTVALYDPFFHPDTHALAATYDFITCTEVIEHFHAPAREFRRLSALLRPGGWLGLTTCFQTDDARFANWSYRRDPTHVVFYRIGTLEYLARRHGWTCEIPAANVALMRKR